MSSYEFLNNAEQNLFLKRYWQKKPFKFPTPFPDISALVQPDELAMLATEPGIEARLVQSDKKFGNWQLNHGPFQKKDFRAMPKTHWTMLVQDVDKFVPDVANILDAFTFLPSWRIDDIMISYAVKGGSVGPHLDRYDVFLIQAQGKRRWQVDARKSADRTLQTEAPLKLLKSFEPSHDWVMEPGDVLYLPPGVPHFGVALDDHCLTYSIGFRSFSLVDIALECISEALSQSTYAERMYTDAHITRKHSLGSVDAQLTKQVQAVLKHGKLDNATLTRRLAATITRPKLPELFQPVPVPAFDIQMRLRRHECTKIVYVADKKSIRLYVCGEEYQLKLKSLALIQYLATAREIDIAALCQDAALMRLMQSWLATGWFYAIERMDVE